MYQNITVERVASLWFPLVKKFYQAHYPSGKPNKADPVWVIKSGPKIIAAVRLKQFNGDYQLLTALLTHPELRNLGYASRLLEAIEQEFNIATYCFNETALIPFYERHDFAVIKEDHLPLELASRLKRYRIKKNTLVAMHYCRRLKTT